MKRLIAILLILVSPALAQETTSANLPVTSVRPTPTSIPSAYSTPQMINSRPLRQLEVINTSDCDLGVSLDGTNTNKTVPKNSAWTDNLGDRKKHHSGNVALRYFATPCTTGSIEISGAE